MVQSGPTLRLVKGDPSAGPVKALADGDPPRGKGLSPEDQLLLDDVRAGRAGIANVVYERLQPVVARTVTRLIGRRDPDFADLCQQALIEIVLHVERFRGEGSLDGWASVTTAHVVWKHLRRRKLERRLFEELLPEVPFAGGGGSPARAAQWRQTASLLKDQLDGMNSDRAAAFVLHDVWGYDLREMAEILGVSVAAAQTRLSRGRRELEERIGKDPALASALFEEPGSVRSDGGDGK